MPKLYGLTGYPLEHSLSKQYFDKLYGGHGGHGLHGLHGGHGLLGEGEGEGLPRYELFPCKTVEEVMGLIKDSDDLLGLNVTIPHKIKILDVLDEVDEVAAKIGAVNCIKIERSGSGLKTVGYNTDHIGFERSFLQSFGNEKGQALILGTGGAAMAAGYVFSKLGIPSRYVSRDKEGLRYSDVTIEQCNEVRFIVNATPVGMFPNVDQCPEIPYEAITMQHRVFDMIYNPGETLFLKKARERGAKVCNGLEMLRIQAEESWRIWGIL